MPDAAKRQALLHHHVGDAALGGVPHGHLAAAVAQLEHQLFVVGHALVQLGLCRDPQVLTLGQVDAVAQVIERALAVVQRRIARQLGVVLETVDAVLEPVVLARLARVVGAVDGFHQLGGRVVFMGAVPAAHMPPFLVGSDDGVEGEPDALRRDGAAQVGDVGQLLAADDAFHHRVRIPHAVFDHVVVAEGAHAHHRRHVVVHVVHRVDGLGVHVAARVPAAGADGVAQALLGVDQVGEQSLAVDGRRRVADGAVVVQRRLDEAVLRDVLYPVLRHRLGDVGGEARVLDVPAGRDQVLDLVVQHRVVAHSVHVVTEREHALVGAPGAQPRLPQRRETHVQRQPADEKQQRVAPVRRVGPVPDRLHVEVGLQHAADQLEHLVGDVDGAVGGDDGGAEPRGGDGAGVAQVTAEFEQVGQHAAARRRLHELHRMAAVAADVHRLPGVVGEWRAFQPAPAGVAGNVARLGRAQAEQGRRQVGAAGDDQAVSGVAHPGLDARDGGGLEVTGVRDEERGVRIQHRSAELGLVHDVVLQVAACQEQVRARRRQIGVLALEPGALLAVGALEGVGLFALRCLLRVCKAAGLTEKHGHVVPARTHPLVHFRDSCVV